MRNQSERSRRRRRKKCTHKNNNNRKKKNCGRFLSLSPEEHHKRMNRFLRAISCARTSLANNENERTASLYSIFTIANFISIPTNWTCNVQFLACDRTAPFTQFVHSILWQKFIAVSRFIWRFASIRLVLLLLVVVVMLLFFFFRCIIHNFTSYVNNSTGWCCGQLCEHQISLLFI